MTENGPCYVNEFSNGTILNPYSLNEHSNVLYIDQPIQAGFSYSTFMNSSFNFVDPDPYASSITPMEAYDGDVPPRTRLSGMGSGRIRVRVVLLILRKML